MQYFKFTKDNIEISPLGFGCMRFPVIDNNLSNIDEKKSEEMIRFAIDNGINYFDTAYNYHSGSSEIFLGKVLKNGLRDKIYLASKNPVWLVEEYSDFERLLDEQLERLQTDHIDFYLLHSLYNKTYKKIIDLDVFKFLDDAKKKGKIKYAGFSFHDELPLFKTIVDAYDWDFCQIQLNYMDRNMQAGLDGLEYAYSKGLGVIIMEPIKGGKLANASEEVEKVWSESKVKRSPAEWALRWVLNHKEVSIVLSGMSTLDQVKENIRIANSKLHNSLTKDELGFIDRVTDIYNKRVKVGCTSCEYCQPCPFNVSIPDIFEMYNNMYIYDTVEQSKKSYEKLKESLKDVSQCTECGVCENICPQHLEIISLLKESEKELI
ncbi:aldo/keto reductase [Tissierella sp. Yu-01]|uniref:aldo/keto reductase n=1 Tax=Tissierella sp. Yu-01 TaxID=3035694 RepID=UPI00240D713B|nr:aldo/keto reductase [Tissierella sp. Yu-01]WFA07614.1 aldo/keto reductase [Tissierella sp. Yu-01]